MTMSLDEKQSHVTGKHKYQVMRRTTLCLLCRSVLRMNAVYSLYFKHCRSMVFCFSSLFITNKIVCVVWLTTAILYNMNLVLTYKRIKCKVNLKQILNVCNNISIKVFVSCFNRNGFHKIMKSQYVFLLCRNIKQTHLFRSFVLHFMFTVYCCINT